MNSQKSFYEATGRKRLVQRDLRRVKRWYMYNYSRILPPSKTALIVDLGCSDGLAMEWLAELGYQNLYGIDSDEVAIVVARNSLRERVPADHFVVADLLEFIYSCDEDSVQLFLMNDIIEHLSKEYLLTLIPEIHRVLSPGGTLVVKTGNMENPFNLGLFARDFTHEILFATSSLRQLMIRCGFDPTRIETGGIGYPTTIRNWPLKLSTFLAGWAIKGIARAMNLRIQETSSLIYCFARKSEPRSKEQNAAAL